MGNPLQTQTALTGPPAELDVIDPSIVNASKTSEITEKYQKERAKRLRPEGNSQFVELTTVSKLANSGNDPWLQIDTENGNRIGNTNSTPKCCKYLIIGAGFGGLLFAVRLLQAGIKIEDLWIVDSAGGYGGTWYWNRYPGLMCDVESYIYMPLLEEMEYMPKHKYAYGPELREYAEKIAAKWKLRKNTLFRTETRTMTWDENEKEWVVELSRQYASKSKPQFNVRSQYVFLTSGVLNVPKMPRIAGLENFQGHSFHASRWDYAYTGGSPTDPSLNHLRDKKVGIIGTGATAVQVIPELAKWAKELYVFQRTPTTVDSRGQHATDPDWWNKKVANKQGWQKERVDNFSAHMSKVTPLPPVNLVDDQWTEGCFHALIGTPGFLTPETIPAHIASLHALDLPHQERIRSRVEEIVKDKATAEKLKPWYYSWCKRPCFHDEYLPAFNLPNVKLIDTDGKGVERVTENGVVVQEQQIELDLLIFSTGYRAPSDGSPGSRAGISITGRTQTMEEKWVEGASTLHGVITRGFPNLFLTGPYQTGAAANWTAVLDQLAIHTSYIISEAEAKVTKKRRKGKVTIEPTVEGEEGWSMQIMSRAGSLAAAAGCTPGYINREGDADRVSTMEEQMKAAKSATWGHGILDYTSVLEGWRTQGGLEGLEVSTGVGKAKARWELGSCAVM
ncbi:FAD/NAD(P)-binding domain-containing protein [Terfezia boudieri ATCC MYA-4762]|uniref:FAD/NAD(P)-binding domain-containing protein n=1 Tax=Terfezia boudieri ATCC MYA-4762 TaxID=1051890 RepID=A0A3N4LX51_9PEZI|nr:FAD/NAD(P)-binding domain-containing protein [Terfezia boudieri ATCC MYA-4762]